MTITETAPKFLPTQPYIPFVLKQQIDTFNTAEFSPTAIDEISYALAQEKRKAVENGMQNTDRLPVWQGALNTGKILKTLHELAPTISSALERYKKLIMDFANKESSIFAKPENGQENPEFVKQLHSFVTAA